MANRTPSAGDAKVYNRDQRLSKPSAYLHDNDYIPMSANIHVAANGDQSDKYMYIAGRAMKVIGISEVHGTAGTDGGAVTLQVRKCTGTTAPASGTALLSATINLKTTANTVSAGTLITTSTADADLTLAPGDRLSLDYTGTLTALASMTVTVDLIPA